MAINNRILMERKTKTSEYLLGNMHFFSKESPRSQHEKHVRFSHLANLLVNLLQAHEACFATCYDDAPIYRSLAVFAVPPPPPPDGAYGRAVKSACFSLKICYKRFDALPQPKCLNNDCPLRRDWSQHQEMKSPDNEKGKGPIT